jgi:hypothetical protein
MTSTDRTALPLLFISSSSALHQLSISSQSALNQLSISSQSALNQLFIITRPPIDNDPQIIPSGLPVTSGAESESLLLLLLRAGTRNRFQIARLNGSADKHPATSNDALSGRGPKEPQETRWSVPAVRLNA